MALSFFEDDTTDDSLSGLDFYGDWIKDDTTKKLKGNKPVEVIQIIKAKSGKGYLVSTSLFNVWLWKNSKITKQLVEALSVYVKQGGHKLFVVPISAKQDGYKLACDKSLSQLWYSDGKKYTQSEIPDEIDGDVTDGNPFL